MSGCALGTKSQTTKDVAHSGAVGCREVLEPLTEQSTKIEKLGRARKGIQERMLNSSPGDINSSFGEANSVFSSLPSTHKCLVESGMEIEKRLDSHPAFRKAVLLQRPEKERIHKKGKSSTSPSYAESPRSQTPKVAGDWKLVGRKRERDKMKKLREECKGAGSTKEGEGAKTFSGR